jgi:hypothetical protein
VRLIDKSGDGIGIHCSAVKDSMTRCKLSSEVGSFFWIDREKFMDVISSQMMLE